MSGLRLADCRRPASISEDGLNLAALSEHVCQNCDYKAMVAGGDSALFAGPITTISCLACKELMDVPYGTFDGKKLKIRCDRSPTHKWVRWETGGPCPKCGGKMNQGENFILAD
jgi:DNA-directed RNA polymerase subunit RPC12/RpoP